MTGALNKVFEDIFNNKDLVKFNNKFNIRKINSDLYELTLNVAGFKKNEIDIKINNGILFVSAKKEFKENEDDQSYIYKGMYISNFENNFSLGNRLEINDATLSNGLLHIMLKDTLLKKDYNN